MDEFVFNLVNINCGIEGMVNVMEKIDLVDSYFVCYGIDGYFSVCVVECKVVEWLFIDVVLVLGDVWCCVKVGVGELDLCYVCLFCSFG